jgi:hypothetical protein
VNDRLAVSTWALHRTLGIRYPDSPTGRGAAEHHSGREPLPLTHLPSALERRGFRAMQLCHFHLKAEPDAIRDLRNALHDSGVALHALLIDDGDIAHPDLGARDADWIRRWLGVAQELGAARARVIAGRQSWSPAARDRAAERLGSLATEFEGLRLEIENWHELLQTPETVHDLLDRLEGKVGLCADWGNWPRPFKYEALPFILPRAETVHAKLEFLGPETLDEEDAAAMIGMTSRAGFSGTYVLVNGGVGDSEWDALELQREALEMAR